MIQHPPKNHRPKKESKVLESNVNGVVVSARLKTAKWRHSSPMQAKLLENNPTLMRLRELEVLEKNVSSGKLQAVLGGARI